MPRAAVRSGLPGIGQDIFPEAAKQSGRDIGLTGEATIFKNEPTDDGGGSLKDKWVEVEKIDARVDPLVAAKPIGLVADQINEESTHIISLDAGADVSTSSRIEIDGKMWAVTGKRTRTDPMIERVEVKGV
jgi:head-tail adaptor